MKPAPFPAVPRRRIWICFDQLRQIARSLDASRRSEEGLPHAARTEGTQTEGLELVGTLGFLDGWELN